MRVIPAAVPDEDVPTFPTNSGFAGDGGGTGLMIAGEEEQATPPACVSATPVIRAPVAAPRPLLVSVNIHCRVAAAPDRLLILPFRSGASAE